MYKQIETITQPTTLKGQGKSGGQVGHKAKEINQACFFCPLPDCKWYGDPDDCPYRPEIDK